ncbi:MAG: hypothetical protein IJS97_00135 [Prevotella sp.]|nr:hypothetical protein [Prevotella sp.]
MTKARLSILLSLTAALVLVACGQKEQGAIPPSSNDGKNNKELLLEGDSTIYGLACEGCTDSVIVLLPSDGSDPVSYNIIEAFKKRRVLGKPKVGDWLGLVLNKEEKGVADLVVDLDELKGTWCYVVMPKLRDQEHLTPKMKARIEQEMTDSMRETYMIPREYGFALKRHWTAQSIGYIQEKNSLEDESPVVYPKLLYYTEWHIWNGKLVMTSGDFKMDKENNVSVTNMRLDTCDIVYLRDDSLVLGSEGVTRSYYRLTSESEINKKAKEMAIKQAKKALEDTK